MKASEAVGRTLARLGVDHVFGVVGSGNFHVTNALVSAGARFVAARHENGAATAADAFSRLTGRPAALTLHQGPGLTNALTGITEAAKSRTPLLVLAADTPAGQTTSNFWIDQAAAVTAVGAEVERLHTAETACADAARAYHRCVSERRTVVLQMPLDAQDGDCEWTDTVPADVGACHPGPSLAAVEELANVMSGARRPVLLAGRGALDARAELERLAAATGSLLTTSGVARGLFAGNSWYLDTMGGFATPVAADLVQGADVVVAFGASLNRWTTRNGTLLPPGTTVAHVDREPEAFGRHRSVDLCVVGDVAAVAAAVTQSLGHYEPATGYRSDDVARRLRREGRWRDVPFEDTSDSERIDPRTLTIALDDILPAQRVVVPDGGNFNGYPAMFLEVPDHRGYCLPLAFQSIGLALPGAVGAALARPDRTAVAGVGDGGFMMSLAELDTAVRLRLPLLVLVYNDDAYGAEVHHFGPEGADLTTVEFPDTDIAAIARGFGCEAVTVRGLDDLGAVADWITGAREGPLVVDAKITSFPSWVLLHTFAGE